MSSKLTVTRNGNNLEIRFSHQTPPLAGCFGYVPIWSLFLLYWALSSMGGGENLAWAVLIVGAVIIGGFALILYSRKVFVEITRDRLNVYTGYLITSRKHSVPTDGIEQLFVSHDEKNKKGETYYFLTMLHRSLPELRLIDGVDDVKLLTELEGLIEEELDIPDRPV